METNKIAKHQFVKLADEASQQKLDGGRFIWQVLRVVKNKPHDLALIVACGVALDVPRSTIVPVNELRLATSDELKAY